MTLACGSFEPSINPVELSWYAAAVIAPIVAFLALPRTLPLRTELRWLRVRALRPLGWLASRLGGDRVEASSWTERVQRAWRWQVEAEHLHRATGEVVRDTKMLRRVRLAGAIGGGAVILGAIGFLIFVFRHGGARYAPQWLAAVVPAIPIGAWVARIGAEALGLHVQSLAMGRSVGKRLGMGVLAGGIYGAVGGAAAMLGGLLWSFPAMCVLTWDPPPISMAAIALGMASGIGAAVGVFVGLLLAVPLALTTRRARILLAAD